jgi:hypothetical protein
MAIMPAVSRGTEETDMGYLKVHANPTVPTIISVNGIPMDGWEIKKVPLPVGEYIVSFTDVPGYVTPEPITAVVSADETTSLTASFARLGMLRVISEPAVKTTISVDGIPRDDYGLWFYATPGQHVVSFGPVEGYDPPSDIVATVKPGEVAEVTGTFTENQIAPGPEGVGFLRVTSTPALPTTIWVDGIPRNTWGLAWLSLPPGTYEVSFGDVGDHATPDPVTVEVQEGSVTEVDGGFTLLGGLRVVTSPPNFATIFVNGIARDTWGIWLVLPEGWYDISFGPVPGHPQLEPCTVLVVPGQTTLVVGTY